MKRWLALLLFFVALFVVLAVTNPDEDSFTEWVENRSKDGSIVENLVDTALDIQTQVGMEYNDRVIFAVVSSTRGRDEVKYLGFFGTWVQIKGSKQ